MYPTTFLSTLALSLATLAQATPCGSSLQARTYLASSPPAYNPPTADTPTTSTPAPQACGNSNAGTVSCCDAKYGDEQNGAVLTSIPLLGPLLSGVFGVPIDLSILPINTKAIGIGCTGVLGSGGSCGKQETVCCMSADTAKATNQSPALISALNGPIDVVKISCPLLLDR